MHRISVLAALLALSCGGGHGTPAPAPTGRSYADYLQQGQEEGPARETLATGKVDSSDAMNVHFIDVGQGSATLVEFPCGAILVDTGGELNDQFDSEPQLVAYLKAFFERRRDLNKTLDALVISHPHIDHTRSIPAVLANFRIRNIIDNGDVQEDIGGKPQIEMHNWLFQHNQEVAARNQARAKKGSKTRELPIGHLDISSEDVGSDGLSNDIVDPVAACSASPVDPKIRALWGMRIGRSEKGLNANNDSVVLRIDYGKSSVLLAADLELLSIAWMSKQYKDHLALLDADIYQVAHHGSRNSTGAAWISYVTPKVAVISMGPYERHLKTWPEFTARSFGHPNVNSVDQLLDDSYGVSAMREQPKEVMVGRRGAWKETPSEFEARVIDRALYATGWDGNVVVTAHPDGKLEVETTGRGDAESVKTPQLSADAASPAAKAAKAPAVAPSAAP